MSNATKLVVDQLGFPIVSPAVTDFNLVPRFAPNAGLVPRANVHVFMTVAMMYHNKLMLLLPMERYNA